MAHHFIRFESFLLEISRGAVHRIQASRGKGLEGKSGQPEFVQNS